MSVFPKFLIAISTSAEIKNVQVVVVEWDADIFGISGNSNDFIAIFEDFLGQKLERKMREDESRRWLILHSFQITEFEKIVHFRPLKISVSDLTFYEIALISDMVILDEMYEWKVSQT